MKHPLLNAVQTFGLAAAAAAFAAAAGVGCRGVAGPAPLAINALPSPIRAVDVSVPSRVHEVTDRPRCRTPRGGWSDVTLRVVLSGQSTRPVLRLPAFARGRSVSAVNAYQVLPAPVNFDTAAYVRQSGEAGGVRAVPRVLLPLAIRPDGTIDLAAARDPEHPTARPTRPPTGGPVLVRVEVRAATDAPAADTDGAFDLLDGPRGDVLGTVPVTLSVADLTLPAVPRLRVTARVDWATLAADRPAAYADVVPRLLSRRDPACAAAVADLDAYQRLAHEHRLDLSVDRVQPIVKWPAGRPPAVDWTDFDAVAGPWLDGSAFADGRPAGFWPLPSPDGLDGFDAPARAQYWAAAAAHFDRRAWPGVHPAVLRPESAGPPTEADALILSAEARLLLDAAPDVSALLPLRADQLRLASATNRSLLSPVTTRRLLTRTAADVRDVTAPAPAADAAPPARYLDATDAGGVDGAVFHGTGDEQDVRSAGWLAFLRDATVVTCGRPLPSTAAAASAVPVDEVPWFYPGSWYGVDGPLPTLQLKWLRQAEQDYEVLRAAADAGDGPAAAATCRLIVKPVDVDGPATPVLSLLGGVTAPHACGDTRDLLLDRAVADRHAAPGGVTPSDLRTARWFNAHQRPTAFATGVAWTWASDDADGPAGRITARVGVDVYDPADPVAGPAEPTGRTLQWETAGGWDPHPPAVDVPAIPACGVRPVTTAARFDLERAGPAPAHAGEPPAVLSLVDGSSVNCPLVLPVATCDRLTRPVTLDGVLDDWYPTDAALLKQPLVRMSSRPAVQAGEARPADHPTTLYTGWTGEDLYVAFAVAGVRAGGVRSARNFVQYQDGRAWGEDLCEATIQPLYVDDTLGPTLHVVLKLGGEWVERQGTDGAWHPFEGAALRYAATVDPDTGTWRGEVAIPWQSLAVPGRGRPSLLRFNFGQHVDATGESATWAGPCDRSRQAEMAGLLVLREVGK